MCAGRDLGRRLCCLFYRNRQVANGFPLFKFWILDLGTKVKVQNLERSIKKKTSIGEGQTK